MDRTLSIPQPHPTTGAAFLYTQKPSPTQQVGEIALCPHLCYNGSGQSDKITQIRHVKMF